MPQFILLPFDPPEPFTDFGPEEMQKIIQRYVGWTEKLRKQGRLKASNKLRHGEGKVLRGAGKKMTVTDGPYVETKEVVGGFWIIEAADYDEAVRLAADCPHLDYGTLSIRAIER